MAKKGVLLFVDDEYYIIQTLKSVFRREFRDYQLEYALSADDGLKLLDNMAEELQGDLVVFSDWLMPGMKGDEFLTEVKKRFPDSVRFLLTGMIDQEPDQSIFTSGVVTSMIQKPWDNDKLIAQLKEHLSQQ